METKTAQHTPLPWKLEVWQKTWEGGGIEFTPTICTATDAIAKACPLYRPDGEPHEASAEQTANAKYIVRAVNCHEELLKACKALRAAYFESGGTPGYDYAGCGEMLDKASRLAVDAIAKAEGGAHE